MIFSVNREIKKLTLFGFTNMELISTPARFELMALVLRVFYQLSFEATSNGVRTFHLRINRYSPTLKKVIYLLLTKMSKISLYMAHSYFWVTCSYAQLTTFRNPFFTRKHQPHPVNFTLGKHHTRVWLSSEFISDVHPPSHAEFGPGLPKWKACVATVPSISV